MSNKIMVTVKDVKVEAYFPPFSVRTKGEAIRSFSDEINNNPDSLIGKHPSDYILFVVGEFDEQTGKLIAYDAPHSLGVGSDFVNVK